MKTSISFITATLYLFFNLSVCADYIGDGKEFEWKKGQKEAVTPLIIGKWSNKKDYYEFSKKGTYEARFKEVEAKVKGFWREDSSRKIYFCSDTTITESSLFVYIGYVKGSQFVRDHICYSYTYTKEKK